MSVLRTSDGIAVEDQALVTSRVRPAVRAVEEGASDREAWGVLISDEARLGAEAVVERDRKRHRPERRAVAVPMFGEAP